MHCLATRHACSQLISVTQSSQSGSLTQTGPDEDDSLNLTWVQYEMTVPVFWFFFSFHFLQFVVVIVSRRAAASGCNCCMCSAMWLDRGRRRMLLSYPPPCTVTSCKIQVKDGRRRGEETERHLEEVDRVRDRKK